MPQISIAIGITLIAIGLMGYLPTHAPTALIPAYIGAVIAICGGIALNPAARKHAMHFAVMVGLLGFLGSAVQLVRALLSAASGLKLFSLASTAVLTFVFVLLCVRSFIQARRKTAMETP